MKRIVYYRSVEILEDSTSNILVTQWPENLYLCGSADSGYELSISDTSASLVVLDSFESFSEHPKAKKVRKNIIMKKNVLFI